MALPARVCVCASLCVRVCVRARASDRACVRACMYARQLLFRECLKVCACACDCVSARAYVCVSVRACVRTLNECSFNELIPGDEEGVKFLKFQEVNTWSIYP
jgi:hypothetical protein